MGIFILQFVIIGSFKNETKEVGRELRPRKGVLSREGSLKKREVSKHKETLSLLNLW